MSKLRLVSLFVAVASVAALLLSVSAFAGSAKTAATTVAVTAGKPSEFHFVVSKKAVKKGVVVFKFSNKGAIAHDFKIGGKKTKVVPAGKSAVLKVTFKKPGKYTYICSLPSHAAAGMKGVIVVK